LGLFLSGLVQLVAAARKVRTTKGVRDVLAI
jgi:hypothetical protein